MAENTKYMFIDRQGACALPAILLHCQKEEEYKRIQYWIGRDSSSASSYSFIANRTRNETRRINEFIERQNGGFVRH